MSATARSGRIVMLRRKVDNWTSSIRSTEISSPPTVTKSLGAISWWTVVGVHWLPECTTSIAVKMASSTVQVGKRQVGRNTSSQGRTCNSDVNPDKRTTKLHNTLSRMPSILNTYLDARN